MSNPVLHYSTEIERPIDWARLLGWSGVIVASCWLLHALIVTAFFMSRSFALWQLGWVVLSATALYISIRQLRSAFSLQTLRKALLALYAFDSLFYLVLIVWRTGPFRGVRTSPWDLVYLFPMLNRFAYSHWLIVLSLVRPSNDDRSAAPTFRRLSIVAALLGLAMVTMWTIRITVRGSLSDGAQYLLLSIKSLDGIADLLSPIIGLALIVAGSWYAKRTRNEAWPMIVIAAMPLVPGTLQVMTLALNQPSGFETAGLMSTTMLRALQSSFVAIVLAIALVARRRTPGGI